MAIVVPLPVPLPREEPCRLVRTLFDSLYLAQRGGWRPLEQNEFRVSGIADCSKALYYSKTRPASELIPPESVPIVIDPALLIVSPRGAVSLIGTMLHEGIQKALGPAARYCERRVEYKDDRGFFLSGTIDIEYTEHDGTPAVNDIKTMSEATYKAIMGTGWASPYARHKYDKSLLQANAYAVIAGYPTFSITWMCQTNLEYRIDRFKTSRESFDACLDKLARVWAAVRARVKPEQEGLAMCKYCDHHRKTCVGLK